MEFAFLGFVAMLLALLAVGIWFATRERALALRRNMALNSSSEPSYGFEVDVWTPWAS